MHATQFAVIFNKPRDSAYGDTMRSIRLADKNALTIEMNLHERPINKTRAYDLARMCCTLLQLLDCYLEAYQNVADITEKRQLSQVIVNIAYQRPRYDFTLDYFVRTYQLECQSLRLQFDLVKSILAVQVCIEISSLRRVLENNSLR